jgi:hypothetical protein
VKSGVPMMRSACKSRQSPFSRQRSSRTFGDDPLGFDLDNTSSFWRGFGKAGGKVEAEDRGSVRRREGWPDPRDPENAAGYRAGARNKRCVE